MTLAAESHVSKPTNVLSVTMAAVVPSYTLVLLIEPAKVTGLRVTVSTPMLLNDTV